MWSWTWTWTWGCVCDVDVGIDVDVDVDVDVDMDVDVLWAWTWICPRTFDLDVDVNMDMYMFCRYTYNVHAGIRSCTIESAWKNYFFNNGTQQFLRGYMIQLPLLTATRGVKFKKQFFLWVCLGLPDLAADGLFLPSISGRRNLWRRRQSSFSFGITLPSIGPPLWRSGRQPKTSSCSTTFPCFLDLVPADQFSIWRVKEELVGLLNAQESPKKALGKAHGEHRSGEVRFRQWAMTWMLAWTEDIWRNPENKHPENYNCRLLIWVFQFAFVCTTAMYMSTNMNTVMYMHDYWIGE